MAPGGRKNEEIFLKKVLETKNILNFKLSFTSNALNYQKYKKLKILWTYTQSYTHYKPLIKDFTSKDLFIYQYYAEIKSKNLY
jgi:hypothetical protein